MSKRCLLDLMASWLFEGSRLAKPAIAVHGNQPLPVGQCFVHVRELKGLSKLWRFEAGRQF